MQASDDLLFYIVRTFVDAIFSLTAAHVFIKRLYEKYDLMKISCIIVCYMSSLSECLHPSNAHKNVVKLT